MDFHVADRDGLDVPAWNNLARNGSFFHTVPWADICIDGAESNSQAVFLCGLDGNRLMAGMPAVITRKFGLKSLYSMPDGTYGAPLFAPDSTHEQQEAFLSHLADYLRRRRFSRTVIVDFMGCLSDWRGYEMDRARHFTHLVSLMEPDEYRPHKKIEYDLRTGQKAASEIVPIRTAAQVDAFYRLYRLTAARHGQTRPRHKRKFFECLLKHLNHSDKLYWSALMAEGDMLGSQIHFIHEDTLFNWQTVSDYDKRRYKPSQVLMYDAICKAVENGLRHVNLGASPPESAGLIRYKERWQGTRKEYDILTARSWFRKLMGR